MRESRQNTNLHLLFVLIERFYFIRIVVTFYKKLFQRISFYVKLHDILVVLFSEFS